MWGLVGLVSLISIFVWGQGLRWQLSGLTVYQLFPVLGLLAFGLMWGHYIVAAVRQLSGLDKQITHSYFTSTSLAVLALILLHPGLLIIQLWRDGFGLPPGSYLTNYVAQGLEWAALLGSLSLLVFLFYELYRWHGQKDWWRFVQYASDVAIVAILVHGFRLGSHLQTGWFRAVWLFYGMTLLAALVTIYTRTNKVKGDA